MLSKVDINGLKDVSKGATFGDISDGTYFKSAKGNLHQKFSATHAQQSNKRYCHRFDGDAPVTVVDVEINVL